MSARHIVFINIISYYSSLQDLFYQKLDAIKLDYFF